jgi:hypothetical protein
MSQSSSREHVNLQIILKEEQDTPPFQSRVGGGWLFANTFMEASSGILLGTSISFGSRSLELALTEAVRSCGIPTVEPIAAIHRSISGLFIEAYLLSLEIPHANDLIQYVQEIGPQPSREKLIRKRRMIRSAGLLLQRFHQSGFFHGDLQLKNILTAEDQVFVIDFDRSYRKGSLSVRERMKNLLRLNRSAEKWRHLGLITERIAGVSLAYAEKIVASGNAMKKAMRTYSVRHFFYRCSWAFNRILRPRF